MKSVSGDLGKFYSLLTTLGVRETVNKVIQTVKWRYYPPLRADAARFRAACVQDADWDAKMNVNTCGDVPLEAAGLPKGDVERGNSTYRAIHIAPFRKIFSFIHVDFPRYTFVDYGSGKGRAMLLASDYPLREIIGIEYAPLLHNAAKDNIKRFQSRTQKCTSLRPIIGDATTFTLPESPLICFFFNPFDEKTMSTVLRAIRLSWLETPRHILLIYYNRRHVDEKLYLFERVAELRAIKVNRFFAIFEFPADSRISSKRKEASQ